MTLAGVYWTGPVENWSDAMPVRCLRLQELTRVELGFVEARYDRDGPGGPARVVTSLRCLE